MSQAADLLRRLVWYGLLAIVIVSPTQYGVEVIPKTHLTLADPLVWGVFALWLAVTLRSPDSARIRFPPVMVGLFVLAGAVSAWHAVHPLKCVKGIGQFIEYFGAAYLLAANVPDELKARRLVDVFLAVATVVVLVAVAQYALAGLADFKVRATFGNRNVLGGYLALVVPLMAGVALFETNRWRRAWLWAVVTLALLVTLSGGAMIAIAVALALVTMARGRVAFVAFAAAFIVILLVVLPRLPRHNDQVLNDSVQLFNDKNEVSLRYTEWQAASVMIAENPWRGVGLDNFQDNIGGYFGVLPRPTGVVEHDSENLYLVLASSVGLPGLACFLGVLLTGGLRAARRFVTDSDARAKGLSLGLAGGLLGFAICSIWSPLLVRGIGVPLAMMLAFTAWGDRTEPLG